MQQQWFHISNIDTIDSPALAFYPARISENIRTAITMAGDVQRLRPHVKTNKTAEVCSMMLQQGITRFKCATIREAAMLAQVQAPDVLLAYQPVGPKIQRLLQLVKEYPHTTFSCVTDNEAQARAIAAVFEQAGSSIGIYIDLNVGMNRTGIVPGEAALQLYTLCRTLPGLHIKGLHAYDGQIHDATEEARKTQADTGFAPVANMMEAIQQQTGKRPAVIAGGSPSFEAHIAREQVELSPGTFVFWDKGYAQMMPDQRFHYAALVLTRVISIVNKELLTLDLGHKAIAPEMPQPRVYFLNHPGATIVAQSEEHLVVQVPDTSVHSIGDVWYGVPHHVCPTVSMYDEAQVIENHTAVQTWKITARGR
ncbi:D-TA family PLP-dependent enzyme [Deminuibacter soli]|uniref:D-TA family PLP-dependent enzyme n=1 Tax=Deminuibacter soli TaxID=2291815 RepID=A0A3E1NNG0_9BACT|nr:D-TA family PLP-dependent enzyme [Deminuibacter soli]RFM29453.1 D-TA family PLP-dependent enzyme [Deminuibacter soli]